MMKITIEPKRESEKGLYYLKADNEIIKRSFNKKKLLAIKKKLEDEVIDIDDIKYNTLIEKDIKLWEDEL